MRTIAVEGPEGTPRKVALCERHVSAVEQARTSAPEVRERQRRMAEIDAWQRTFGEPAPFAPPV